MTPLALLALIQELPPPPEPTGSPEIDTVRVIGVVIVSLGVIVLLALAIRPLVVKPPRHKRTPKDNDPSPGAGPEQTAPFGSGSIIQFPKALVAEGAAGGPVWTETNASIAERFNRVVGESGGRRRKLGDRNPARPSHDLATAAMHRVTPEARPWPFGGTSVVSAAPVVAIHGAERDTAPRLRTVEPAPEWTPTRLPQTPERTPVAEILAEESPSAVTASTGVVDAVQIAMTDDEPVAAPSPIETEANLDEQPDVIVPPAENVVGETPVLSAPAGDVIETTTLAALHQVVRDLIYCANAGELLQGFALYSDPYLFRFLDESGLSDEEFRDTFGSVKARPRDAWEHLDRLFDIVVLPGGAIEATASYVSASGQPTDGLERYRFVEVDGIWMIDDIIPFQPRAD